MMNISPSNYSLHFLASFIADRLAEKHGEKKRAKNGQSNTPHSPLGQVFGTHSA